MKWTPGGQSDDVEDRRDDDGGGGGGGGLPLGRMGLGGTVVLLILSVAFGRNFFAMVPQQRMPVGPAPGVPTQPRAHSAAEQKMVQFVSFVIDDVQKTWERELPAQTQRPYSHSKLVLFSNLTRSGCGRAEEAMGPFYCPADQKVYIDLAFYDELRTRFGAPGEFAEAYVIAHEVGHHVQNLLGTESKLRQLQSAHPGQANALSVRMELQADCLAGVWAHSTRERNILEAGDIESGLGAAAAVGDDRLQKQATGHVNPESWTHGSSKQRVDWFTKGFRTGRIDACDTFDARSP